MRIAIFHGYLLGGTGSNVYNANLARALARLGHDVHLLCQDRDAAAMSWVNATGAWDAGELRVEGSIPAGDAGSVTVYVPDIGGLLPVYVADDYEGFEVKTFAELTDAELDSYIEANVSAVRDVAERVGGFDAALANHVVMGPLIMARAGVGSFAAKVHGSALSYTVKPNPRFVPHAEEGMAAAAGVLVGSQHTAESLWETIPDPQLRRKTRLGPPGVDLERFEPGDRRTAISSIASMAGTIEYEKGDLGFGRDPEAATIALRRFAGSTGPRVLFVGKLIVSKGVDLLLASWPLIARENPGATLLIAGFGAYRDSLERLWGHIERGDLAVARGIALRGREAEGGARSEPLTILSEFLDAPPAGYREAAALAAGSVVFSGRLEHAEVADVMPAADVFVMPSTFPEAFGMVAAEAAACGVPPVSAGHSGMQEVSDRLAPAVGASLAELLSFQVGTGAIEQIAGNVNGWLALPIVERRELGRRLAARVAELWSWDEVARGVIAASLGDLGTLPHVPRLANE